MENTVKEQNLGIISLIYYLAQVCQLIHCELEKTHRESQKNDEDQQENAKLIKEEEELNVRCAEASRIRAEN